MARPPRDPSLSSWPWGSAPSGSGGPSSAVGLTSLPIVNSHAESAAMVLAVVAKRGTSDLVGSGRRWSRLDWAAAQSEHSCCRHGDVAEETTAVDNSVDPSSQSTAHAEACSAIPLPCGRGARRITSTVG